MSSKPLSARLNEALLERYSKSVIEKDMDVIVERIKADSPTASSVSLAGIQPATVKALIGEGWKIENNVLFFLPDTTSEAAPPPPPQQRVAVLEMKHPRDRSDTAVADDTQAEIEELQASIYQLNRKKETSEFPDEVAACEREISMALKALRALKKLGART